MKEPFYPNQLIPLVLTALICALGVGLLMGHIHILNFFMGSKDPIVPILKWHDIAVGTVIYLKTSIDFALFIGRLMADYPGWKNRVAIEVGTALGNVVGTLCILTLWTVFKEIKILLAVMIIIAGLVLLRLAETGLKHVETEKNNNSSLIRICRNISIILQKINGFFAPLLEKIIPHSDLKEGKETTWYQLLTLSFTVPFILGADDFAGYISLFNVVNVMGFATGVFIGHMILNNALFISPTTTIRVVRNPIISFIGSIAFIAIAVWGFIEAEHLIIAIIKG